MMESARSGPVSDIINVVGKIIIINITPWMTLLTFLPLHWMNSIHAESLIEIVRESGKLKFPMRKNRFPQWKIIIPPGKIQFPVTKGKEIKRK